MPTMLHLPVSAPRPIPRPWATALTTYAELVGPEWAADSKGVMRWLNGVTFVPFGCEKIVGDVLDPCVERITDVQEGMSDPVTFDPFLMEVAVTCSALSVTSEDLLEYVTAHTEVARSSILGAQVMQGAYATDNPSLASEAQVISGGDGSPASALALIEDALADLLDGGAGMVHATPGLFARLQSGGGLMFLNGDWYTATGHLVVADAGYVGPNPADGVVTAGAPYLYGSGPVFFKLYPNVTIVGQPWENFDYTRDNFRVDVEQYGIAFFEPCSVVAAAVDLTP